MVYSPSTRATVSTVAERMATRMLGSRTRRMVVSQSPPSERDASTRVWTSMDRTPASRAR